MRPFRKLGTPDGPALLRGVSCRGAATVCRREEVHRRVGLWTKADSVIAFDDFTIESR